MARKARIDWEAVEKDYRTGKYSTRQLGERHNCSNASVANKAKEMGWKKDLTKQISQRTKNKSVEMTTGKTDDAEIVEAAAEENARIINTHKGYVSKWQERTDKFASLIDDAMTKPEKQDPDNPWECDIRAIGNAINSGTQALQRLIQLERQANNLDDGDDTEAGKTLEELLAQVSG